MSLIANCDWPDEYPDLLSLLITLLSSNAPDSVHGAMQVFTEFIKSDLTEDQILPVLRQLLPVLLGILGSTEVLFSKFYLAFALSLIPMGAAAHSLDTGSDCVSFSSMCHRAVYGQRSASTSCKGSNCFCPSRVA